MFFGVCFRESLVRKAEVGRGETDPLQQNLAVPSEVQGQFPVRSVAARCQRHLFLAAGVWECPT